MKQYSFYSILLAYPTKDDGARQTLRKFLGLKKEDLVIYFKNNFAAYFFLPDQFKRQTLSAFILKN